MERPSALLVSYSEFLKTTTAAAAAAAAAAATTTLHFIWL